ncbi:MAG: threonylcarbamoyl-AMP synthase [Ilumatobacter sp.]|nr:threonylcarbamoyl-AMP synthase [Ilumatobacter sp.]
MSLLTTDVDRAASALLRGGLVAVPTETVYGLAADASNAAAVARIFEVKGRPADHPLIVHLADPADLDEWATAPSAAARRLAETAWPGAMTIIVRKAAKVASVVTGGRDTVGLRVPAHPLARRLLSLSGVAVAAPSANRFGAVSPTTAAHVIDDIGHLLDPARDVVLDGGPCEIGLESTIVDTTTTPPQLLRVGSITVEEVETLLDDHVAAASGPARASGMLPSHYAPRCAVRLVDSPDDAIALAAGTSGAEILDLTGDLADFARRLYAELRSADERGAAVVIAVLPPATGLGVAIRDRLHKAAAPRPG